MIGLDGCSDGTAEIVRRFEDRGVRLLDFGERRGKASVLNAAMNLVEGEIVLMSDANTDIDPQAARRLVRWFQNPEVGAVVGRLILTDPRSGKNADGLYWKYETFLKRCEGRLGALLGANGAIYAIRRELYVPIPAETIIDDFVIPLLAKLRSGCAIVYDCDAVAREETPPDVSSEFHRRARIGAGGFQSIALLWRLLDPRRGWVAFTFLSHKVLRWLCPFFLIGLLASNLFLLERPFFRWILGGTNSFSTAYRLAAIFAPKAVTAAQTDSVDDDVHEHERRPAGGFHPLDSGSGRMPPGSGRPGSWKRAERSDERLRFVRNPRRCTPGLCSRRRGRLGGAATRTGPLAFHVSPRAIEAARATVWRAGPSLAVHRRSFRAGKRWRDPGDARERMQRWVEDYPRLCEQFRDSDGRPPRHTFFYPIEMYDEEEVERPRGDLPPRAGRGRDSPPSRRRHVGKPTTHAADVQGTCWLGDTGCSPGIGKPVRSRMVSCTGIGHLTTRVPTDAGAE